MTDLGDKLAAPRDSAMEKSRRLSRRPKCKRKRMHQTGDFADMEAAMARKLAENGPAPKVSSTSEAVSPGAGAPCHRGADVGGRQRRSIETESVPAAGCAGKAALTEPISNADPEPGHPRREPGRRMKPLRRPQL